MNITDILDKSFRQMNIILNNNQIEQFMKYKKLLIDWNKKINLTAITDEKEIILKHFADSVSILNEIDIKGLDIIDVGTGAGFPGIPIKIVQPDINMTLMDSLMKRVKFLEAVSEELNINNIHCVHSRAEDAGKNEYYREKFDICVSRAVASLSILSEYCMPFVKVGGMFTALKGPSVKSEIIDAENAIKLLGGEIYDVKSINLPFIDLNHYIVFIKKLRQTPPKYPRNSAKISKSPIK